MDTTEMLPERQDERSTKPMKRVRQITPPGYIDTKTCMYECKMKTRRRNRKLKDAIKCLAFWNLSTTMMLNSTTVHGQVSRKVGQRRWFTKAMFENLLDYDDEEPYLNVNKKLLYQQETSRHKIRTTGKRRIGEVTTRGTRLQRWTS